MDFTNGRNKHHRNVTSKYGQGNILVYVFPCDSEAQAFADEIQQIAQLRRDGYVLANISDGGEGPSGMRHSAESKVKMSLALSRRVITDATREKLRIASTGNTHGRACRGMIRSEQQRIAMANRRRGKVASVETRAKMSAAHQNMSIETRAKISAAGMGRKHSDSTKEKMSRSATERQAKKKQE